MGLEAGQREGVIASTSGDTDPRHDGRDYFLAGGVTGADCPATNG